MDKSIWILPFPSRGHSLIDGNKEVQQDYFQVYRDSVQGPLGSGLFNLRSQEEHLRKGWRNPETKPSEISVLLNGCLIPCLQPKMQGHP